MHHASHGWNWASWFWVAWIALGFFPLELWALFSGNDQDTLSDNVWRLEGTGATFFRYFVAAFLVWLFFHMVYGWFRS